MMAGYDSFGLIDRHPRAAISLDAARRIFESGDPGRDGFLPFGNGKSYGDSCHNDRGTLVDMRESDQLISFDPQTGLLAAEAGLMLSDIIALAAPHGYFLPVTPGTRFVTLGGAIANDVHGKNHHRRGTFGCHVERFDLLKSDGTVVTCSTSMNSKLFAATIGGLGLTGIILSASIRLMKVNSLDVAESVKPFAGLAEYFEMAPQADNDNEYAVAWVDQLSSGRRAGRGVLLTGNHADNGSFEARTEELETGRAFRASHIGTELSESQTVQRLLLSFEKPQAKTSSQHLSGLLLSTRPCLELESALRKERAVSTSKHHSGRCRLHCNSADAGRHARGGTKLILDSAQTLRKRRFTRDHVVSAGGLHVDG